MFGSVFYFCLSLYFYVNIRNCRLLRNDIFSPINDVRYYSICFHSNISKLTTIFTSMIAMKYNFSKFISKGAKDIEFAFFKVGDFN